MFAAPSASIGKLKAIWRRAWSKKKNPTQSNGVASELIRCELRPKNLMKLTLAQIRSRKMDSIWPFDRRLLADRDKPRWTMPKFTK